MIIERIKQLMTSRSQTANAFAIQADINSSNFAKKLKGTMKITKADIDRICDNIGVGRGWLINGEGDVYTSEGKAMIENKFAIKFAETIKNKKKQKPHSMMSFSLWDLTRCITMSQTFHLST